MTSHIGVVARASTKAQIIDAGLAELHARGYSACSVEDITWAAGVPKGSFYNHFASKEALALEAVRRYSGVSGWAVGPDDGSAIARLRSAFEALHAVLRRHRFSRGCMFGNMANELADHSDVVRAELVVSMDAWSASVAELVAEAQRNQETAAAGDAHLLGRFIVNSWEGAVTRSRVAKNDQPIEDFFVTIFDFLLA